MTTKHLNLVSQVYKGQMSTVQAFAFWNSLRRRANALVWFETLSWPLGKIKLESLRSYGSCCNENVTLNGSLPRYIRLRVLRLFHQVGHVVQNRQSVHSHVWHESLWFSCKGKEWKIYCSGLALSSESQMWNFHVVVWQSASKMLHQEACRTCSKIVYRHSTNQIIDWWRWHCRCLRPYLNSQISYNTQIDF